MAEAAPPNPTPTRGAPWEALGWTALLVWLWVSRWWVAPAVPFEWDSANYLLAMRDFDIYQHQPHPPGNPAFVVLLRLFAFTGWPAGPFLVTNGLLGAATLALLGWMCRREIGAAGAWSVAAAATLCPPFWQQGAATTAYVAESFVCACGGAIAVALARSAVSPPVGAALFAAVVAVRPTAAAVLVPVVAAGSWVGRPSVRDSALAVVAFGVTCAAWWVPTVWLGGGLGPYRAAGDALWDWQLELGSVLGDGHAVGQNTRLLLMYLGDALNLLWLAVLVNVAAAAAARRLPWRALAFLALWTGPACGLYALHHLPKSGYVLSLVPAVFALWGISVAAALDTPWARWLRWFNGGWTALWALVNLYAFAYAVPPELLDRPLPDLPVPSGVVVTGDYGRIGLELHVRPHRQAAALLDRLDDDADLALFLFGSHELWRVQAAMRPDQWTVATSLDHHAWLDNRSAGGSPSFGAFQEVVLRAPDLGIDADTPTRLGLDHEAAVLTVSRPGRGLDVALGRIPGRIVAFVPCPPCTLTAGEGLALGPAWYLGGGVAAVEIDVRSLPNIDLHDSP